MSDYFSPHPPPRTAYVIDVRGDPGAGVLDCKETIRFQNVTARTIGRLAIWRWDAVAHRPDGAPQITVNAEPVCFLGDSDQLRHDTPALVELPEPLGPGQELQAEVHFAMEWDSGAQLFLMRDWHPRLWWSTPTPDLCLPFVNWQHDDFEVTLELPDGYVVMSTGRLDSGTGVWRAQRVRDFGIAIGTNVGVVEAAAGEVLVRSCLLADTEPCARLLLETAVDAIGFYRERFGFYPQRSLTILPGMDEPEGGCAVATGMVAIHGQARIRERDDLHWRWYMAHEIGPQYWLEHVLPRNLPSSATLVLGLGIHADREYVASRGLGLREHERLMRYYTDGVRQGLDTTVDIPPQHLGDLDIDYNNIIAHGKGYSIIGALRCVLGDAAFYRAYCRCLAQFAGRQFGIEELRTVCEDECHELMGWFFEQWCLSNRYLSYEIASQECIQGDAGYVTSIQVERRGTLRMPIPVEVVFTDGSVQRRSTDRLLDRSTLRFDSSSPLENARLDPKQLLAMATPAPAPQQ
jgi:hypothetical protein